MAPLQGSGQIKFSDIRTEFGGGTGAISFSDFYRGGTKVRSKAGNNTATNLAASVPTSGAISTSDFYGTERGFRKTYSSGATNQNLSTVFGDDWGVDYPKDVVINSGVELGATSTGDEALQVNSGASGTVTITNNGTISGAGGSASGGTGGDAFEADAACTLVNNGTIRAGGGGGGNGGNGGTGGTGGQGSFTSTSYGPLTYQTFPGGSGGANHYIPGGKARVRNAYFNGSTSNGGMSFKDGNITRASTGLFRGNAYIGGPVDDVVYISYGNYNDDGDGTGHSGGNYQRETKTTSTTITSGGAGGSGGSGGAGGRGQGYNQTQQNGSGGSSGAGGAGGGTNAGSGGTGGTGGTGGNGGNYGQGGGSGATGSTGATGNSGNHSGGQAGSGGSGGSGGGSAGKYIRGLSNVTFTNNGTVQGGTA